MEDAISAARLMISDRIEYHPDSPFYRFAAKEMERVDQRIGQGPRPDRAFYESLTRGLGLMCARELEAGDMPFCDAMYKMMGKIRSLTE